MEMLVTQAAPPYAMQVPLEIVYAGRRETRKIDIAKDRQTVSLALDAIPDGVRVDPELRLWRVLDARELPPILRQWIVAAKPTLVLASIDREVRLAGESVARSLFESTAQEIAPAALANSAEPVLVVGLHRDVDAVLAAQALTRPALPGDRGSAEVWTAKHPRSGTPIAIVSARDADALKAVLRALPHYGSQSYLVFDGPKVIARGVWPAEAPLIRVGREQ